MGCGKTSVGKALASLLGYRFIDLDEYIEHKATLSIPEIFAEGGQQRFRALEAEAVRDVIAMSAIKAENVVLALGGGTLTIGALRRYILSNTRCIYLVASEDVLRSRLLSDDASLRPMLASRPLEELLAERLPLYAQAELTVNTDGLSPEECAARIAAEIRG